MTKKAPGVIDVARTVAHGVNTSTCVDVSETTEPGNVALQVSVAHGRDAFGNIKSETRTWHEPADSPLSTANQDRTLVIQSATYDPTGRFPVTGQERAEPLGDPRL